MKKIQLKLFAEKILNYKSFVYVFYIRFKSNELCHIYSKQRARVMTMNVSKKIFKCFREFKNLNNEDEAYKSSEHKSINHAIKLKKNKSSSYDFIYFLSKSELKILRKYLNKYLKNNFIRFFQSFVKTFILFVKKKNDSLRLCVNYKAFNNLIIKNKYFLSLINESLNRLKEIKMYINLNLIAAYHRIRIKKNDK